MSIGDVVVYIYDPVGLGPGIIVDITENGRLKVLFDTDDEYCEEFVALELELASVWESKHVKQAA